MNEYGKPPAMIDKDLFSNESEVRFGQKWLLIIGIGITVLSVGYFLKFSFDQNWIGAGGRVAIAYAAGLGMLLTGEVMLRKRLPLFGLFLIGGSLAIFYFAGYAAFQLYELIGQPVALGLMVIVTVAAGVLAVLHDTKGLAMLGIIGGFSTPMILSTGVDNQVGLMTYMVILNGGILGIAIYKQWSVLNKLGQGFTWALFSAWFVQYYNGDKFWPTILFLNAFFLIYATVPFAHHMVHRSNKRLVGVVSTIPNAFIAFGYAFVMIRAHSGIQAVSAVSLAYAGIFFAMANYVRRISPDSDQAFFLLLAKGLLFLIVTVPILFSQYWISVFWTAQGLVLIWAAPRIGDSRLRVAGIALLAISTVKVFLYDYPFVFGLRFDKVAFADGFNSLWLARLVTVTTSLASLLAAGHWLLKAEPDKSRRNGNIADLFCDVFGVLLFAVLNVEVAAYFHDVAPNARFASISVLWAIFSAGLLSLGFVFNNTAYRRVSMGLFGATVLKVFISDMANVDTPYRILSFLIVGLMLVGASYLYHRYAERLLASHDSRQ